MSPTPTALGMHICEWLIVEETTRRVSLINCFSALRAPAFPTGPRPFWIFTDLTDGNGSGTAELAILQEGTDELVHSQAKPIRFADRLQVVQYRWGMGCPTLARLSLDGVTEMKKPDLPTDPESNGDTPNRVESFNGPNVVTIIVEGYGDNTIRPMPPELRPYLTWHPRPEKPPKHDD